MRSMQLATRTARKGRVEADLEQDDPNQEGDTAQVRGSGVPRAERGILHLMESPNLLHENPLSALYHDDDIEAHAKRGECQSDHDEADDDLRPTSTAWETLHITANGAEKLSPYKLVGVFRNRDPFFRRTVIGAAPRAEGPFVREAQPALRVDAVRHEVTTKTIAASLDNRNPGPHSRRRRPHSDCYTDRPWEA